MTYETGPDLHPLDGSYLVVVSKDLACSGAVASAIQSGLHPSDEPSERNTQNADTLYFVALSYTKVPPGGSLGQ